MELGYARNLPFYKGLEQESDLHKTRPKLTVYVAGRGAEDLEAVKIAFRKRGGILWLATDMRVLADTQTEILAIYKDLKDIGIIVADNATGERSDRDGVEMQRRAAASLQYDKAMGGDRKTARKRGAKGGRGKAVSAAAKRDGVADEEVIRRVCEFKKLTWRDRAYLLGISVASLRRHYMKKR